MLGNQGGGGGLHLVLRDGYPYMGFFSNDLGSGSLLSINTWYHIAWRYNTATGEMALFKDGVLISSGGGHPAFLGTGSTFIGRCCETWDAPRYAKGQIDDVQIYGRSLTDAEVASVVVPPVTTSIPASCTEILLNGDSVGDGVYTIDPAQNGNDLSVYCDMTTDGGGWTLVGYGADSNLAGQLTVANGVYNPTSRTGSANIEAVALARMSTEVSLSWSFSAANGGLSTYAEAVGYAIPNPAAQTLDPGPLWYGYNCVSPYWTEVTVNPLVGAPNLPSQMYTRTSSLGAVYGFAYGLARSDGNPQCDWYIDGQAFRAVYLGINSGSQFRGVVYNPGGSSSHVIPATMAIWFRGSVPDVVVDTTPPAISVEVSGTLGSNGWYTSDVTVTWTVADEESAATTTWCEAQSVVTDTTGVTFTCTAESEGGTAEESVTIKRDATNPTLTGSRSPAANGSGWNNTPVTVTFACDDAGSGVASCVGDTTLTGEGAGQSAGGVVTDFAGNTASTTVGDINIDLTAPVVTVPGPIAVNASGASGTAVTSTATASDALDATPSLSCLPVSGSTFAIGTTTVTCTAADDAGNGASRSFDVTVNDITTPGRMHGEGFVRSGGKRYGFTFDVRERANGGERGHLRLDVRAEERSGRGRGDDDGDDDARGGSGRGPRVDRFVARSVLFVAFSDDPSYRPGRPRRLQIDTVLFSGIGEWNGVGGYSYEVFAADQGEPGRHRESVRITVRDGSGAVVAHVDGVLSGGNVQSVRIKH